MLLCQLNSHMIILSRDGRKTFYYCMQIFLSVETKLIWFSSLESLWTLPAPFPRSGSEQTPEIYYKYQRQKGDELHLGGGRKESPKNKPQSTCHPDKLITLLPDREFFFFEREGEGVLFWFIGILQNSRLSCTSAMWACWRYCFFQVVLSFFPSWKLLFSK